MKTLKNKNVFITGGTSGLGKELTLQLIALGARVGIMARNEGGLSKLLEIEPTLVGIQGDVSDKEKIYSIAGEIQSKLGPIDYLFNVASSLGEAPLRLLVDSECEDFEKVLQTNVLGPFRLTKALLPGMLLRGEGVVINISSDAGVNAYPKWGFYGVSKAALDHLSRIFDEELKSHGIRFLSIDPGDMRTPMYFAAIPDADPDKLRDPADSASRIIKIISEEDFSVVRRSV